MLLRLLLELLVLVGEREEREDEEGPDDARGGELAEQRVRHPTTAPVYGPPTSVSAKRTEPREAGRERVGSVFIDRYREKLRCDECRERFCGVEPLRSFGKKDPLSEGMRVGSERLSYLDAAPRIELGRPGL